MALKNMEEQPGAAADRNGRKTRLRKYTLSVCRAMVLILSLMLIVYISDDTFRSVPFLNNRTYMKFQLWVCVFFLIDFFVEFFFADDKRAYLGSRWFFFLISIPYLNIIKQCDIHFSESVLYYLRFVPLLRGAYSLSMVVGYVSQNRAVSLLWQYVAILASAVYILALIFYYQEYGTNPDVKDFWDALYWAAMNMVTVGCYFTAVTPVGKVISVILPILGMMIIPLITAYVTDKVNIFNQNGGKNTDVRQG